MVLEYMDSAKKRTQDIGSKKKVDCFGFLYCAKVLPLNKSMSKSIELGLDPNDSFNLSIKIKDKKTGMVFETTLEGAIKLIAEIKFILKIDVNETEFGRCLLSGDIAVSLKENEIYELNQATGLCTVKSMFIHKTSLMNLINMEQVFLLYSLYYNDMAGKFIGYIKKYVQITRTLFKQGLDKENKMFALHREMSSAHKLEESEKEFIADTLVKFPMYFASFFQFFYIHCQGHSFIPFETDHFK